MTRVVHMPGRASLLVAAVTCGCLAVWALALAYADLAMSRPRAAMAAWEQGLPMDDYQLRRRLLARIGSAIAVHPFDAAQRLDLGRFFAWHAARHPQDAARARLLNRLAADRFEEAVAARPTWGYAWLLMAERWSLTGAVPAARVDAAVHRGAGLAPLEPAAQLKFLWLGLARWPELDGSRREALRAALERMLASRSHFDEAARIALHHGRADLVNAAMRAPWQQQAFAVLAQGRGG